MPAFNCFKLGSSSSSSSSQYSDGNGNANAYPKRRRFSLTRSLSFSGTSPTKKIRSVSSFFKTIRKNGSKKSSTSSSSANTDEEDYGSAWTYYPVGHIVRVNGVDFEIVSPPCVRAPTAKESRSYQPSPRPFEDLTSTSSEPSESGGSGSGLNLIEVDGAETVIDAPETQELRRQASLDSQLRYLDAAWRESEVATYYRPGSIYGQMMGIDAAIDALMSQEIYNINPEHPLIQGDLSRPHSTRTVESAMGVDSENFKANPTPKYIRRKPVPAF